MTRLGALRVVDRPAWERRVMGAIGQYGRGACPEAAVELGVSVRTLRRWAREVGAEPVAPRPYSAKGHPARVALQNAPKGDRSLLTDEDRARIAENDRRGRKGQTQAAVEAMIAELVRSRDRRA